MAHHLDYYFRADGLSTADVMAGALDALRNQGVQGVELDDEYSAGGATDGTIMVGGVDTGILIRVHVGDRTLDSQWAFLSGLPGAPSVENASGSCALTLSGAVNSSVLEILRGFLKAGLGAAEYDEISGFID